MLICKACGHKADVHAYVTHSLTHPDEKACYGVQYNLQGLHMYEPCDCITPEYMDVDMSYAELDYHTDIVLV